MAVVLKKLFTNDPYIQVNIIIAGIILAMLIYSGIFSADGLTHPIKSLTTQPTVSTGLSRAFSEIVRLNFSKAIEFNVYSIHLFLFFFIQLFQRVTIILLLLSINISKKLLTITDILISVLLFLWAFFNFIIDQLKNALLM